MDLAHFNAALRALITSPGPRRAVPALAAVGVGLLSEAGGREHEDAVAADKRRRKRRRSRPSRGEPPPPPAAVTDDPVDKLAGETSEDGLVASEAKQGKPGPAGPNGLTGQTGPAGERGAIATSFVPAGELLAATLFATVTVDAECPASSEVIVGGFDTSVNGAQTGEVKVNSAEAVEADGDTPALYRVTFTRTGTATPDPIVVFAFAVCSP